MKLGHSSRSKRKHRLEKDTWRRRTRPILPRASASSRARARRRPRPPRKSSPRHVVAHTRTRPLRQPHVRARGGYWLIVFARPFSQVASARYAWLRVQAATRTPTAALADDIKPQARASFVALSRQALSRQAPWMALIVFCAPAGGLRAAQLRFDAHGHRVRGDRLELRHPLQYESLADADRDAGADRAQLVRSRFGGRPPP